MAAHAHKCKATTKAGAPCKNNAQPDSEYCYTHRQLGAASPQKVQTAIADVNRLAAELQREEPGFQPPPFSPQALLALLQQNAARVSAHFPLVNELRRNLQGTKPEDLMDPETWKGLWYILNFTAQAQSKQVLDSLALRLAELPGGTTLMSVKATLDSTTPKDLLDIETWKGAWLIANTTVQAGADELKHKVLHK